LAEAPAATYPGGIDGLSGTRPHGGQRLDSGARTVRDYQVHLDREQTRVAGSVGARPLVRFSLAFNGFTAQLTADQATRLAHDPGVTAVVRDTRRTIALYDTPNVLGLAGSQGTWAQLGGASAAGKGVVVGVLDTGIWPENAMFAGGQVTGTAPAGVGSAYRGTDGRIHVVKANGKEFVGTCQAGVSFPATTCTSKLVGARFFNAGFRAQVPTDLLGDHEYLSPRDGDSHGSHTSSTAAGAHVASMTTGGRTFGAGSGMAPAAKIAAYKVCWTTKNNELDGCDTADIISAVDAAIADGVDVINYSIGTSDPAGAADPVQQALLNAAAAGVFVAAAGGNSGPDESTVDNNSPWVTTVAATTVHRLEGTVKLGNGKLYKGASLTTKDTATAGVVLADAIAAKGATIDDALLCTGGTLDPAKAKGKIVVCDRGIIARVDKSAEVKRVGGAGMVLVNTTALEVDPDVHAVPTVHLPDTARNAVRAYVSGTANPTIQLLAGDRTGGPATPVPVVAGFSSRGPDLTSNGNLVKPDVAAPGVGILAAVAPVDNADGDNYAMESGTSMATPHIAGLAALIIGRHPDWSPMRVKSALMTTATDTWTQTGGRATNPFAQGAGMVNPQRFLDPGLVYDSGAEDWLAYLKGSGLSTSDKVAAIDPVTLNLPSLGAGAVPGKAVITRKVTATTPGQYTASIALPGFQAKVTPDTLNFSKAEQQATFTVTLTRTTAPLGQFSTGFLTWTSGTHTVVRSPIAVRPIPLSAPAEVTTQAGKDGGSYQVTPGTTTPIRLSFAGLAAGSVTNGSVAVGAPNLGTQGNAANKVFKVMVPDGTKLTRFEVRTAQAGHVVTMYLLDSVGKVMESNDKPAAVLHLDRPDPISSTYYLVVNGAAVNGSSASGDGPISFSLRVFNVPTGAGKITATPNPLSGAPGTPATIRLSWPALKAGTPYLGLISYSGSDRTTLVAVG
jgi:subtilisin family serine protease